MNSGAETDDTRPRLGRILSFHPVMQSITLPTAERERLCIRHVEREIEADKKLPDRFKPLRDLPTRGTCTKRLLQKTSSMRL